MPNRLPIPAELQHLIEKRQGGDRRAETSESSSTESDGASEVAENNDARRQGRRQDDQ